jgi:hypothetical protein
VWGEGVAARSAALGAHSAARITPRALISTLWCGKAMTGDGKYIYASNPITKVVNGRTGIGSQAQTILMDFIDEHQSTLDLFKYYWLI